MNNRIINKNCKLFSGRDRYISNRTELPRNVGNRRIAYSLVVDAIKLLLLKMERNLRMYCQELGEDLPEWEEINVIPEPGTATIIGFSGRSAPGSD